MKRLNFNICFLFSFLFIVSCNTIKNNETYFSKQLTNKIKKELNKNNRIVILEKSNSIDANKRILLVLSNNTSIQFKNYFLDSVYYVSNSLASDRYILDNFDDKVNSKDSLGDLKLLKSHYTYYIFYEIKIDDLGNLIKEDKGRLTY